MNTYTVVLVYSTHGDVNTFMETYEAPTPAAAIDEARGECVMSYGKIELYDVIVLPGARFDIATPSMWLGTVAQTKGGER
jgi:hypothetical protein